MGKNGWHDTKDQATKIHNPKRWDINEGNCVIAPAYYPEEASWVWVSKEMRWRLVDALSWRNRVKSPQRSTELWFAEQRTKKKSTAQRGNCSDLWRTVSNYSTEHDQHICVSKLSRVRGKIKKKKKEGKVPGYTHRAKDSAIPMENHQCHRILW